MELDKMITNYRDEIEDIAKGNGVSPFETHYTFHCRSVLHECYDKLNNEQKKELNKADLLLLNNISSVHDHLIQIYNFNDSNHTLQEWWWHLDKVLSDVIKPDI